MHSATIKITENVLLEEKPTPAEIILKTEFPVMYFTVFPFAIFCS
jgi:hypothetical protein